MTRSPRGRLELTWMGKDSAIIPVDDGKYDYMWVDPEDPRAREVKSVEVLEQVGAADGHTGAGENLLILGDSGDALRSLGTIPEYTKKYRGQVKLVYIDPPFNTKQTFEHYADQLEHSIWLTMMRDRIRDIKPLLADDASVWVHLDDVEVHRMRLLLDEEFGAENFVAEFVWQKVYAPENRSKLSRDQDFIIVYANKRAATMKSLNAMPRSAAQDVAYKNPDDDPRGRWKPADATAKAEVGRRREQFYSITLPNGKVVDPPSGRCWLYTRPRFEEMLADDRVWFGEDGGSRPAIKRFLSEVKQTRTPSTWWPYQEVGHNQDGKKEVKVLFPETTPFSTPKPERLLHRVVSIATNPGDLVLDCFAGSGTTAAVAHKLNRRWVTVELQESTAKSFIIPRLTKVVNGDDPGGITATVERIAVDDLPEGMSPEEAQNFTTLLGKVSRSLEGLDGATLKALRVATRTRDVKTLQWGGGGGFTVARMGPSMYEIDDTDGEVFMSTAATNGAWSKAVAGQLRFTLTPDDPVFCGIRGRQRLAVIDGVVDDTVVNTIVESLDDRQRALIVAKAVLPGAAELLATLSPGSRIKKAPEQMFSSRTVK